MKKATVKAVASIVGGLAVFLIAFMFFQSSPKTAEAMMTRQEAEKIAQEQFQGEVVSVEFDDGRYEIDIESDDVSYELELDADTGEILKLEEKRYPNRVAQKSKAEETKSERQEKIEESKTDTNDESKNETNVEIKEESNKEQKAEVKKETKETKKETKEVKKEEQKEKTQSNSNENKKSKEKSSRNVVLTPSEAMKVARSQVSNATIIDIELESDDGRRYYEIEMHTDDQEVEIEIDAYSGEVIMFDIERLDDRRKGNSSIISMEEAIRIAFAKEPNAWFEQAQLDRDDGKYYYEIELKSAKYEIEFEIDAQTGKIIDMEYDD